MMLSISEHVLLFLFLGQAVYFLVVNNNVTLLMDTYK